jgi:two-component system, NtrC family, sensor kinase
LGTPLNVVSGTADFILASQLSQSEIRDNATIIRDQAERMSAIIQQLLHFARRRMPNKLAVDLREVVRQTLAFMGPLGKKQNVAMLSSVKETPVVARADSAQIQQVLSNLILNAVQAMPHGGTVEVGVCHATIAQPENTKNAAGEYACIFVVDEGDGIPQENLDHVFDPFFTTKEIGHGTGLGLSIAYGIVAEHGGWIEVKSECGKGSCFSVYLPTEE